MNNRRTRFLSALVALLIFSLSPLSISRAQRSAIDTYAITGARIVTVSGPVIERGTVVMRNGLIAAVGANVGVPPDARLVDGSGLTVYPGLIDAYTTLGIPAPAPSPARSAGAQSTPAAPPSQPTQFSSPNPTQPPGLQPEILAVDLIRPGGAEMEAARNAGITSALTAPREGIFMGQSALINLSGNTATEMVLRSPVALHVGFTPLRSGVYPASLLGVFSALRQMLLDAGRLREANRIYERNPRGIRRPEQDRSLVALIPALARELPVVMFANTEREILRALDLAEEFNLRLVIAGGEESWKVADQLRARSVPVLLSLNFPRRATAQLPELDQEPLRVMRARVDAPRTAARLSAARVPFAFQSGSMTDMNDFLRNAARAVEHGLARDEALRALTLRAAEIFGVADRLGSIEVGKIANLTIVRGDLFDKTARLSHVFIDGRPVDLRPVAPGATAGAMATGTWALNVNLGEGDMSATLTIEQQGERLRGTLQGALGSSEIANASIGAAGDIRFTAPVSIGGLTTEATFSGTLTGNEMRGTVQIVDRAPGSFTGTRPAGPPAATPQPPAQPQSTPVPSPTPAAAASNSARDELSGRWSINFIIGSEKVPATLTLRRAGTILEGRIEGPFPAAEIRNGSAGTNGFQFTSTLTLSGQTVLMTFTGNITSVETSNAGAGGDLRGMIISGTVTSGLGSVAFTGTRSREES